MATRYADPPLARMPSAKPTITVAFVAGPAQVAALDAAARLPEAQHSLDGASSTNKWDVAKTKLVSELAARDEYQFGALTSACAAHERAKSEGIGVEAAFEHVQSCEARYDELVDGVSKATMALAVLPAPNDRELGFKLKAMVDDEFYHTKGYDRATAVLAADADRLLAHGSASRAEPLANDAPTFDRTALSAATGTLVATVSEIVGREHGLLICDWLASSLYGNVQYLHGSEGLLRCHAERGAMKALEGFGLGSVHSIAVQAYIAHLWQQGVATFGPRNAGDCDEADRLLWAISETSPIPALIDAWATKVWAASSSTGYLDRDLGFTVLAALEKAREQIWSRQEVSTVAAWREAHDRYLRLRAVSDALPNGDPTEDVALDRYCAAMDRLITKVQAPNAAALAVKLELAFHRAGDDALLDGHAAALLHDAHRLAGTEVMA